MGMLPARSYIRTDRLVGLNYLERVEVAKHRFLSDCIANRVITSGDGNNILGYRNDSSDDVLVIFHHKLTAAIGVTAMTIRVFKQGGQSSVISASTFWDNIYYVILSKGDYFEVNATVVLDFQDITYYVTNI
jgi:hypothetical protein